MSAKEMFEKLGYKLIQDDMNWLIYVLNSTKWFEFKIEFYKINKTITFTSTTQTNGKMIDIKELKAINQQCKELGWIE